MSNNNLNSYDFIEGQEFIPKTYGVIISPDDKIISVTGDGSLLGVVKLDIENNTISLIGKDGTKFSSADLPLVDVISDAYYDEEQTALIIKVVLSDGSEKDIVVPFNDLLEDYAKKADVEKNTEAISDINEDIIELSKNLANEIDNRKTADDEIKEKLDNKVDWTDISTEENPNRKSIVLENHDTILGKTTEGGTVNIAMVSKWNKVDVGSSSVEINLNGSATHPTYNDKEELAFVKDVNELKTNVENSLQELKSKDDDLQRQINLISGTEGELSKELEELKAKDAALEQKDTELESKIDAEIAERTEKDAELQSKIEAEETARTEKDAELESKIDAEIAERTEQDSAIQESIKTEESARTEKDAELQSKIEAEETARTEKDTELESKIDNKVDWTDISTEENPNRKSIVLENHDTILGKTTEGGTVNIAMVSKWNKVDVGSSSVEINLNGSAIHPTYNDKEELAFVSDITSSSGSISKEIEDLKNKDAELEEKINNETSERESADKVIQDDLNALKEEAVKWTDIHTEDLPNRKSIVLKNHDTILGTDTNGSTSNLVMLSKWDIADFGSKSTHINLNGKEEHPTYNDDKVIALIDDINNATQSIKLVKNSDLEYTLMVGEVEAGSITIPKDQFLKSVSYEEETQELVFIFETVEGENTVRIDMSELANIYKAGLGLNLQDGTFNVVIDNSSETNKYLQVSEQGLKIVGIDEKFAKYTPTDSLNEDFATKVELTEEVNRAKGEEAKLLGTISDTEEVMSLYGVKKYASNNQGEIADINIKINTIESNFDNYVTKQESVEQHDDIITQAKSYTDTKVEEEKAATITEAVNQSKEYTDSKVSTIENVITSNTDRITKVEGRCDHYDDLFSMILDEHGDPIELNFYTKSEIDDKVTSLNEKDTELEGKIDNKVDWTDISTEENPNRKSIVLKNHDTILGTDTKGETSSLLMINKWDVVDLGTTKLPINLNTPSGVRPTVQEAGQTGEEANKIAYLSDIKGVYSLGEVESFNNLDEKAAQKGICDNQDNVILTFKITTVPYGKESGFIVNIRNGNKISQALYWKQALEPQMYRELTIDENGDIANVEFTANSNRTLFKDSLPNQTIFTLTTEADNETIKTALTDVLHGSNALTKEQLDDCIKYGYYILESSMRVPVYVGWNGSSYTLTMFGLPNPKGDLVAATVSLSISDDNSTYTITRNGSRSTILTSSNLDKNSSIIDLHSTDNLLASKIAVLEEKLAKLSKTNVDEVELNELSEATFDDITKDYIISGSETKTTTVKGKTVKLDNLTITNNARTNIMANDVELKSVNISGDFPKENGNSVININNAEYIVVKDMIFDSSNVYNGIEIGLSSETLPKSILFENCQFLGQFANNAILIFGTQANAVININNCYFENLSNPFRLSNSKNTSCVMNITNCKIDKWDVNSPWQGMMLLQDYTSGDAEKANTNNLFAPEKITINVINTIGPNGKKVTMPNDISEVCGTGNEKQLFYIWDNYRDLVPYDKSKYPTINIL